jgi:hypothetical protein
MPVAKIKADFLNVKRLCGNLNNMVGKTRQYDQVHILGGMV